MNAASVRPSETESLPSDPAGLVRGAEILRAGGLVAFPTETVYGLGADACNGEAVAGIYAAKGRPSFNPLIVHLASVEQAHSFVNWSEEAERLAEAFWPGPLTMVLELAPGSELSGLVTAGLSTVGIRVPAHPVARALLAEFGGPVAAPSANPSGRLSPTRAEHVVDGLSGRIDAVVEGGVCEVGLESTIVGLYGGTASLLRPGGVTAEAIENILGHALQVVGLEDKPVAPGQLSSHYAPGARVRLNAEAVEDGELLLGFGDVVADLNLSPSGDLIEAAANLFEMLHALDQRVPEGIAVSPVPELGLGVAINDRLRRAAAPR